MSLFEVGPPGMLIFWTIVTAADMLVFRFLRFARQTKQSPRIIKDMLNRLPRPLALLPSLLSKSYDTRIKKVTRWMVFWKGAMTAAIAFLWVFWWLLMLSCTVTGCQGTNPLLHGFSIFLSAAFMLMTIRWSRKQMDRYQPSSVR